MFVPVVFMFGHNSHTQSSDECREAPPSLLGYLWGTNEMSSYGRVRSA